MSTDEDAAAHQTTVERSQRADPQAVKARSKISAVGCLR